MTSAVGIAGPGMGLPYPQYLYPSELTGNLNAPADIATNRIGLNPGEAFVLPRGNWYLFDNRYCVVQFQDPITGVWAFGNNAALAGGTRFISSDGFTTRIANMTGCIVGAVVTAVGTGFTSAPGITSSAGSGYSFSAIVGGAVSLNTIVLPGAGYGLPPILAIAAPPAGGIPATAYALLANGTVSAVSFISQGAGYTSPPLVTVITNPNDPNISTIGTIAQVTTSLTAAGGLTGVLVMQSGAPLTSIQVTSGFSLTVSGGGGAAATVVPVVMQTILSASVTALGGGYGTNNAGPYLTTMGGVPNSGSTIGAPGNSFLAWYPRPAQIQLNVASAQVSTTGNIYESGLFLGAPNPVVVGGAPSTAASVVLTLGGKPDYFGLTPTN
jgi:hypothetical protein